jgi:hypothetical protein
MGQLASKQGDWPCPDPLARDALRNNLLKVKSTGENAMTRLIKRLAASAAGTLLAASAFAQSAKEVRGASPYKPS